MPLYSGSYRIKVNVLGTKELSYVIDFGLPVEIEFNNINSGEIVECWIGKEGNKTGKYGNIVLHEDKNTITYTPTSVLLDKEEIFITYKYSVGSGTIYKYKIKIVPASNVLYEENFLTEEDGNLNGITYTAWTENAEASWDAQELQKANSSGNFFGTDSVYQNVTGKKGYWEITGLTKSSDSSRPLTTSFYGNGFDLIGSCGQDTGLVVLYIRKPDVQRPVKTVFIETYYSKGDFDNVPLAHVMLDEETNYTATVYAYVPLNAGVATASDFYSGYSDILEAAYTQLAAMGVDEDDVEFISMSEVLGDTNVGTVAADADSTGTTASSYRAVIDGFRVYRSTNDLLAKTYYPLREQSTFYTLINNIINLKYITSFSNENLTITTSNEFEQINFSCILQPNESLIFDIPEVNEIQISLQAIFGETTWNTENTIKSNIAMYYLLDKYDDCFVITNTGNNPLVMDFVKSKSTNFVTDLSEDIIKKNIAMSYCYRDQLMDVNYIGLYDSEGQALFAKEEEINNE